MFFFNWKRIIFQTTWKFPQIKISVHNVYWNIAMPFHDVLVHGSFQAVTADMSSCDGDFFGLRGLKYLLSGPLHNQFADHCSRAHTVNISVMLHPNTYGTHNLWVAEGVWQPPCQWNRAHLWVEDGKEYQKSMSAYLKLRCLYLEVQSQEWHRIIHEATIIHTLLCGFTFKRPWKRREVLFVFFFVFFFSPKGNKTPAFQAFFFFGFIFKN